MSEIVTEQDILDAIREAMEGVPDNEAGTITTVEASGALGLSPKTARAKLGRLADAGLLQADYIRRVNRWGVQTRVMGWRYVGE